MLTWTIRGKKSSLGRFVSSSWSQPFPVFLFFFPPMIPCSEPGEVLSLMEDLFSGLGSSCIVAGKRTGERPHSVQYSVVFKCLEPDSLYK